MGFSKTFAATAVLSTLISNALALNVDSKTNVAVYYGQGANQPRLSHFCQESSVDIINIGFINVFPEAVGDWPGSNFGNQCDGNVYENTELLSGCHQIWEDIPVCKELGKTVMLSLGGETAYQTIASDEVAEWFADFLWYSFGPPGQNSSFPRPFQDNQVDGFDFDIEHDGGYGYATMIRRLRSHFADFPDETFYISGAPQCQLPDAQLSDAISNSEFDFIWVQWYNTAGCSAMNFVDGTGLFNFAQWSEVIKHSANPNAKLFVGLPASESAAVDGFYLTPAEVYPLVDIYMNLYPDLFGGIMLWEATASDNNVINGHDYAQHMKHILHKCDPSPPQTSTSTVFVTPTPTPTSSTPSSSAVHTSSSSSQTASSQSSSSIASSSSSLSSSVDSTTAPPHSSTPVVSSSSVTGSSTTPIASSSVSSTSSASSHGISSSTPVASGSSSVKPTVTPSETPSSSGSGTTTQSGTSSSPASHTSSSAGHSSSSTPVKLTHTASETVRTSTTPIVSTSSSSTESSSTESTSTNNVDSSSSSISRVPSRTPITRTPVSSSPSATGTHASSTRRPLTTDSSSKTTTDSAAASSSSSSSTGSSENSSNGGNVSTGKPAPSGSESSTASHSANNGGESTTSTLSTGGSTATGAESSTGVQPTGNGSNSGTASVVTASPSVTSIATTTKAPTVTTIIVTSYTDICPTGFTTITTTITTTFCPEATATAGVTNHPSRPASTTPSIPEGWTTTVKVCDNCAPTPTTVTLTLPNPTETAVPSLETSAIDIVTKTWTTTVTFCKHCGVTGSLITKTVPYTPAISTATAVETPGTAETPGTVETPGSPSGQGDVTIPVEVPRPTAGNTQVVVPSHRPSSSWVHVSGGIHSPTHTPTFKVHASTTSTVQNSAPTGNAGDVSPTFNAAGSRSSLMNLFGISIAAVFSLCILI